MKTVALIAILLIFCPDAQSQNSSTAREEPGAIFEITINGKSYPILQGESLKLDSIIDKPVISVKLSDYKIFNKSSLSFRYPAFMSYEFQQDFGFKNWTLNGNNLSILFFEMDAETNLNMLVSEMVKKFGKKNCSVEDFRKELGNKTCDGKKLFVSLIGQKLVLECYEIKLNDYKSRFLYFQDVITEEQHSKEYYSALEMVNSTIVYK